MQSLNVMLSFIEIYLYDYVLFKVMNWEFKLNEAKKNLRTGGPSWSETRPKKEWILPVFRQKICIEWVTGVQSLHELFQPVQCYGLLQRMLTI